MSCITILSLLANKQIRHQATNWAVSLVILHMVTSIFMRGMCGYIWVNILTLSPQNETTLEGEREKEKEKGGSI